MRVFADYRIGEIHKTRGRTITEADIVNYCSISGDWYPLHSDAEFAKKSPFGERIAHGMLVLTVVTGLMPLYDMGILAFYGIDKLRFLGPTKIGDTLYVETTVVETQDKSDTHGVVTLEVRARNQRGEDVMVMMSKVAIVKRTEFLGQLDR